MPETLEQVSFEKEKCETSFLYFLSFCKLVAAPTQDNPGGLIPFELWPHLRETIAAFLQERFVVVLKARQIGLSYMVAAYVLWHVLFHYGSKWLLFSRSEDEAIELLSKCHRIYDHLPEYLKAKLGADSLTQIAFPSMESSIQAKPSTETAGVGYTASGIVCDEWDVHLNAAANFFNAAPALSTSGGQFIGIFTANNPIPDTTAKTTFRDAREKKNDFKALFFPWSVVPGRDQAWYDYVERNIPETELQGFTREVHMMRNFPTTEQDALSPIQTVQAFDVKVLNEMMEDTRNPIKVTRDGIDTRYVNIFQDFHIGGFYVASTDTGHGIGKDFSVTTIMDVKTGSIVADIMSNRVAHHEFAMYSVRLLDIYQNPLWFPEDNEWGRVLINKAVELGYKRWGKYGPKKDKIGIHMNDPVRTDLFGALIPAINNHQITIFNENGLKQFFDVARLGADGKIEAIGGRHDDYVIAVGICWLKKDEVKTTTFTPRVIQTLTWG